MDRVEQLLTEKLTPSFLEVVNESHLHAGHQAHFDGKGETHIRIRVVSSSFSGLNRIERHRLVNTVVAPLMDEGLHAVAIEAKAPEEAG